MRNLAWTRRIAAVLVLAAVMGVVVPAMAAVFVPLPWATAGVAYAAPGGGQQDNKDRGFVDPDMFNVFGEKNKELLNTGLGQLTGALLARVFVLVFDIAIVLAMALIFWKLILLIVGKLGRKDINDQVLNILIGVVGVIAIMTGIAAMALNYLIKGAEQIKTDVQGQGMAVPPAAVAFLDDAAGAADGRRG